MLATAGCIKNRLIKGELGERFPIEFHCIDIRERYVLLGFKSSY